MIFRELIIISEKILAKIITFVLILLTFLSIKAEGSESEKLSELFLHYNCKLSMKEANYYAGLVIKAGKKYSVDPSLIASMIVHESNARTNAISKGGDYGLMQVRWKVHHKDFGIKNSSDLLKPELNIDVGTQIFARYYAQKKSIRKALLRYSAGNVRLANKILKTYGDFK